MQSETMPYRIVRQFFLVLVFFIVIETKEVIWRFDSDISNPDNWIDGKLAEGCKGIHFSEVNTAPVSISSLTTGEVQLPHDGSIVFEKNAFIELKDNKKCIKLKPIDVHYWEDPNSWVHPDNVAIPDKERIPCVDDDVILPKKAHVDLHFNNLIRVRSIRTKEGADLNLHLFHIGTSPCTDPYGCLCHDHPVICYENQEEVPLNCENPIVPEESCHGICGAYLTFKPGRGPKLEEIRKKLREYQVDTYASRVKNYLGGEMVQVVFGENEYTGRSVEEAEIFREFLEEAGAGKVQMYKSGEILEGGGHGLGIIFGSLVGVLVFFGVLIYFHGKPSVMDVVGRFSRSRGSIFNTSFFARFDTTDENLIIDGHSETGSILDIAKSFDNPMYNQPSTADHENPLYEVTKDIEE